jgi:hypothetical protein
VFILGVIVGIVLAVGVIIAFCIYDSTLETPAERVERELREAKRAVDKIFSTTQVRLDSAAENYDDDLPPNWREHLKRDFFDGCYFSCWYTINLVSVPRCPRRRRSLTLSSWRVSGTLCTTSRR